MSAYTFNYKKIGNIYRPIIDVRVRYNGKFLDYGVLLDSGADFSIFHEDVADFLGIDLSKGNLQTFGGINSGKKAAKGRWGSFDIGMKMDFYSTQAVFTKDISTNGYAILGQVGFFSMFDSVQFSYPEKKVYIKKYNNSN